MRREIYTRFHHAWICKRSWRKTDALHASKHIWLHTGFGNVPVLTSSKPIVQQSRSLRLGWFYRRLPRRTKKLVQLDIITAFLESKIQEEIYLQLPKRFRVSFGGKILLQDGYNGDKSGTRTTNVVVQRKKSLYGLPQAGCNWYNTLESHLKKELGMEISKYEAGIYTT